MACSVYFAQYLLEALYRSGRDEAALRLLTAEDDRSWIGMMHKGATITMESWNRHVKSNLDWNHSWGATPLNAISRFLLGIMPIEPGFAKVRIAPHPAGLQKVSARIPTIRGVLRMTIEGNELSVDAPVAAEIEWKGTRRICKIQD